MNSLARSAFTLVELLMAMTITLLLMAALAKSFAIIGQSIKVGRSQVTLSSKLRSISFRLRTDLRMRTADVTPPMRSQKGQGYFMYYEGPLTEHTFALFAACPQRTLPDGRIVFPFNPRDTTNNTLIDTDFTTNREAGPTYRRFSRYGDFDDYIAFTAEAPGDDWFTGKVPAYLVDDTAADPMEPRIIRSKFAEIIIWASPKWQVDASDAAVKDNVLDLAAHPSGMPIYQDEDLNIVPDQIVLHQRTLLIRPDLNVRRIVPIGGNFNFEADVLRPQNNDVNPYVVPAALRRLYPIGTPNPHTNPPTVGAVQPIFPDYAHGSSATDNTFMFQSNWLVGMTPLHHFFDLSLRRVIHPVTGAPTGYVAANSIQDLVQPHNRFAHVRYPGRYFGRGDFSTGDDATSMPLLALGWNDAILNWQGTTDPRAETPTATAPAWFPINQASPLTLNTAGTPPVTDDSLSGLFNGWLLPHFELGDPNPPSPGNTHWQRGYLTATTADARWDRTGEDVIATDIFAFDVKGFDRTAPVFLTGGPDGQPGNAGIDDDGLGGGADTTAVLTSFAFGTQASSELGTTGSDDQIVTTGDPGIYDLINAGILDPENTATFGVDLQSLGSRGTFVDLMYPYLAGSPLRERTDQGRQIAPVAIPTTPRPATIRTPVPQVRLNYNAFMQSDLSLFPIPVTTLNSMKRSGKLVHNGTGGNICYFQPTYDTWTDGYESDGFDQTHTLDASVTGVSQVGTTWVLNGLTGPRMVAPVAAVTQVDTGGMIPTDPETSPPFAVELPAVSITIRVSDPKTEEMTQFTVVEGLQ